MTAVMLADAVARAPEPPCTRYSCTYVARCRDDRLACDAFDVYVATGRSLPPHTVRVPGRKLATRPGTCRPTRATYDALFVTHAER
jgi:hypothetical protein